MKHNHDESCFSISGLCNRNDSSPVLEKGSRPFIFLFFFSYFNKYSFIFSKPIFLLCRNHNFFVDCLNRYVSIFFFPTAFHHSAQFAGLLCEEQGSDADNVKYCGYCKYHHSKLVSVLSDFCHFPEITCLLCVCFNNVDENVFSVPLTTIGDKHVDITHTSHNYWFTFSTVRNVVLLSLLL